MDPPSFSNSKKMSNTLDIQRDHARLIQGAMKLLAPNGLMYFSNNLRSFALDESIAEQYLVKDISKQSVPDDFRNKKNPPNAGKSATADRPARPYALRPSESTASTKL